MSKVFNIPQSEEQPEVRTEDESGQEHLPNHEADQVDLSVAHEIN